MTTETQALIERLTRPLIGIENRTPQEVFDIMGDRIRRDATALSEAEAKLALRDAALADAAGIKARLLEGYSHRGDGLPTQQFNRDGPEAVRLIEALEGKLAGAREGFEKIMVRTKRHRADTLEDDRRDKFHAYSTARACLAELGGV